MSSEEIDRILSRKEEIAPSSGFVVSVMEAVRAEASTPAPIPFPWRRAFPGLVAAGVAIALLIAVSVGQLISKTTGASAAWSSAADGNLMLAAASRYGLGWILLTFLIALVSVKLSMRLAGVRT